MEPAQTFWYCQACPVQEQCSDASFKRASVWGWDEAECRQRLYEHLVKSAKRQELDESDARTLSEEAEVMLAEWVPPQPSQGKRRKTGGGGGEGGRNITLDSHAAQLIAEQLAKVGKSQFAATPGGERKNVSPTSPSISSCIIITTTIIIMIAIDVIIITTIIIITIIIIIIITIISATISTILNMISSVGKVTRCQGAPPPSAAAAAWAGQARSSASRRRSSNCCSSRSRASSRCRCRSWRTRWTLAPGP